MKRRIFLLAGLFILSLARSQAATNISLSPNTKSISPRIAVDSRGNTHAVWGEQYSSDSGDVFYTRFDAGKSQWTTPVNISNSGRVACDSAMTCALDVEASDRVYAVWVEGSEVKLRTCQDGSWGGVVQVQSGGGRTDTPRIQAGSEGNLYIIWWTLDGYVYSRSRVNGNWEGIQIISDTGRRSKFSDIAVGNGVVSAVWAEKSGELYQAVYSQRGRGFGSGWSSRQSVSPSSLSQQHAVVELDSSDTAHVVWTTVLSESGTRVVHYSYKLGGGFTSPQEISAAQTLHYPSVYKKGYNLYGCWQLGAWGGGQGVNYATGRSGSWGGETFVPDSGGSTFCDIATSPGEETIYIVWDANNEIFIHSTGAPPPPPPPGNPPVARYAYTPFTGEAPLEITFDGSASTATDATIVGYAWDFGDGGTGAGKIIKHTFSKPGRFSVKLTVTDSKQRTGSTVKSVEILKPNEPPVVEFTFFPGNDIFWRDSATFDGSLSSDSDGQIAGYAWDFGDGETATGKVVSHYFKKWGNHQVQLTVTDNRNAKGSKAKTIPILRLFQPLNIRWETFEDEGLFLTRYVTDVLWERNPENEKLGPVVKYRIYRKKESEPASAYKPIYDLGANSFRYRDPDVGGSNNYAYSVTAIDAKGHESPIEGYPYFDWDAPPVPGKGSMRPAGKSPWPPRIQIK